MKSCLIGEIRPFKNPTEDGPDRARQACSIRTFNNHMQMPHDDNETGGIKRINSLPLLELPTASEHSGPDGHSKAPLDSPSGCSPSLSMKETTPRSLKTLIPDSVARSNHMNVTISPGLPNSPPLIKSVSGIGLQTPRGGDSPREESSPRVTLKFHSFDLMSTDTGVVTEEMPVLNNKDKDFRKKPSGKQVMMRISQFENKSDKNKVDPLDYLYGDVR